MRRTIYILTIFILLCGIALAAYAPDGLSMAFIIAMEMLVALGALLGILPVMQYARGLRTGLKGINRATSISRSCAASGNPARCSATSTII